MADGRYEIDKFMRKLQHKSPTADRQAGYILEAMQAIVQSKPVWSVEEVDKRFIEIKGNLPKEAENVSLSSRVGRMGEVALHDSIMLTFKKPEMRKKWGLNAVKIGADLIIPVDLRSDFEDYELDRLVEASIKHAREIMASLIAGKSRPDFLFQTDFLESKATYRTRIFPSGERKERKYPSYIRSKPDNEYIRQLAKSGSHTIVGYTVVDAIYDNIGKDLYDKLEESVDNMEKELYQFGKEQGKHGKTLEVHTDIDERKGGIFELVGFEIVAFVPEVIDEANFKKNMQKYFHPLRAKLGGVLMREIAETSSRKITVTDKYKILRGE